MPTSNSSPVTTTFTWPKKSSSTTEAKTQFESFARKLAPRPATRHEIELRGLPVTAHGLAILDAMHRSESPLTVAATHSLSAADVINTIAPSLLTLQFSTMQSGFTSVLAQAKTDADKRKLQSDWQANVKSFTDAFARIGMPGIDETRLVHFSRDLHSDPRAVESLITIQNSKEVTERTGATNTRAVGGFVQHVSTAPFVQIGSIVLPKNLCTQPFVQGNFTKHLGQVFSLQVHLDYPCITGWHKVWGIPVWPIWGWCSATYTLANLSYNVDLNVGYKVTCCGGSAWGSASASVCGSILSVQVCASCSASIVGAVGVSKTTTASGCTYGLGLVAELKCTFAGVTIFDIQYPFGYAFNGPCPPLPC